MGIIAKVGVALQQLFGKLAEEALANRDSTIDYAKAQAELVAAAAQLAAIQKLRQKR